MMLTILVVTADQLYDTLQSLLYSIRHKANICFQVHNIRVSNTLYRTPQLLLSEWRSLSALQFHLSPSDLKKNIHTKRQPK